MSHDFHRHDTAADGLPSNVQLRLDRYMRRHVVVVTENLADIPQMASLMPADWQVDFTDTPREATKHVMSGRPVAIIAGIRLRETDGLGFLRDISAMYPDVRRILMGEPGDGQSFLRAVNEAAVYRFLATPLNREALDDVLDAAFSARRREVAVQFLVEDVRTQNMQFARARQALKERESHLLHCERLAVLGRLTEGLALGIQPILKELVEVVSLLRGGEVESLDLELLSMGEEAADAIGDIIRDIQHFTQDEAIVIEREETDLEVLLERTVRFTSFDRRLRDRQLHVKLDEIPNVFIDTRKMRQVVLNLLRNAAEATPAGGNIFVEARVDGDDVVIEVADQGTGIPMEVAEHIFEEFFSTKGEAGLGLGLSLCRSIVEEHGGSIACYSMLGEGTTITIRMPCLTSPLEKGKATLSRETFE